MPLNRSLSPDFIPSPVGLCPRTKRREERGERLAMHESPGWRWGRNSRRSLWRAGGAAGVRMGRTWEGGKRVIREIFGG